MYFVGTAGASDSSNNQMIESIRNNRDKKASSLKYASLGKRTLARDISEHLAGTLDTGLNKRAGNSYRYASLGKRQTDDLHDYLIKRSGAFKYGGLGKRDQTGTQEVPDFDSKRGASAFKYSSLGKRGPSAFRYSSLGKRGNSAFRYSSLGKRDIQDLVGSDLIGNRLPDYTHHKMEKRSIASSQNHDILAKRLGYAYKYASVGKRVPVPPDMHKKWYTANSQSVSEPFQRRAAAFRYIGVGKRDINPGIKYASLGKRQSQWKYAGLGKRSVASEERLSQLLEYLLDQQMNSVGTADQSYSDFEQLDIPVTETDDWSDWQ